MPPKDSVNSTSDAALQPGEVGAVVEHMLNGMAYCRMLFENGQPSDFIYLYTNPAFESLTGLSNVIGRRVTDVIPGSVNPTPSHLRFMAVSPEVARRKNSKPRRLHLVLNHGLPPQAGTLRRRIRRHHRAQAGGAGSAAGQRTAVAGATHCGRGGVGLGHPRRDTHLVERTLSPVRLDPAATAATFDRWRSVVHPDDLQMAEEVIAATLRDHVSALQRIPNRLVDRGGAAGSMHSATPPTMRTATHSA